MELEDEVKKYKSLWVAAFKERDLWHKAAVSLAGRVRKLEYAWKQSWDCSADPGHKIMHQAMED